MAGNWMAAFIEAEYERIAAVLRAKLGEPAFDAAWAEGRGRDLNGVVEHVLDHGSAL